MFPTGKDYQISTLWDLFNVFFTGTILTIFFLPFRKLHNIKKIEIVNKYRLKQFTSFSITLGSFLLVILVITSVVVLLFVDNISEFKYTENVAFEFYYNMLPINIKFYLFAIHFYTFGYFLIILHFHFLLLKDYKKAFYCFITSLIIVFYGLTFFSRWTIIHYVLLYLCFFFVFYKGLDSQIRHKVKIWAGSLGIICMILFVAISVNRFSNNEMYDDEFIPNESMIKEPVIFSHVDYLGQSYNNGLTILSNYKHTTMRGQNSIKPVLEIFSHFGFINFDSDALYWKRRELLDDNYYTFTGLVSSMVYDFGYVFTFILSILYNLLVNRLLNIRNSSITLNNCLWLILLIQIPLFSIFYSFIGGIVVPILFLIPIGVYLRIKRI